MAFRLGRKRRGSGDRRVDAGEVRSHPLDRRQQVPRGAVPGQCAEFLQVQRQLTFGDADPRFDEFAPGEEQRSDTVGGDGPDIGQFAGFAILALLLDARHRRRHRGLLARREEGCRVHQLLAGGGMVSGRRQGIGALGLTLNEKGHGDDLVAHVVELGLVGAYADVASLGRRRELGIEGDRPREVTALESVLIDPVHRLGHCPGKPPQQGLTVHRDRFVMDHGQDAQRHPAVEGPCREHGPRQVPSPFRIAVARQHEGPGQFDPQSQTALIIGVARFAHGCFGSVEVGGRALHVAAGDAVQRAGAQQAHPAHPVAVGQARIGKGGVAGGDPGRAERGRRAPRIARRAQGPDDAEELGGLLGHAVAVGARRSIAVALLVHGSRRGLRRWHDQQSRG